MLLDIWKIEQVIDFVYVYLLRGGYRVTCVGKQVTL